MGARWVETVLLGDVWRDDTISFQEQRDIICRRIRRLKWAKWSSDADVLLDELAQTECFDDFNMVWDAIYDLADIDRIWIDVHSSPAAPS